MSNLIITIGRQFGSGGRAVGKELAKELGIGYYDKEILNVAAKESGLCQSLFEHHDEKPTNSFLYSLVMDTYSMGYNSGSYLDMPLNHKVFLAQFDSIKKLAERESCVIVGRCADYALEDFSNVYRVFIHANMDCRIKRVMEYDSVNEAKAKDIILKNDKQRSSYYNYYTSKKWGDAKSYDLTINSSVLGIDGCVSMIKYMLEKVDAMNK